MRITTLAMLAIILLCTGMPLFAQTTFTVNSNRDEPDQFPGDGQCDTGATIGLAPECTLRAAIQEANQTTGPVIIDFWDQIEDDDGWTIITERFGGMTPIQNEITIAGDTHPLYDSDEGAPRVVLQSEPTTDTVNGLTLLGDFASNSVIRAIAVVGFTGHGIVIDGGSEHVIEDSTIGAYWRADTLNLNGNEGIGIRISNAASGSIIRHNFIVDNGNHGILIPNCISGMCPGPTGNISISGNGIGLAPRVNEEHQPAGNGGAGVYVGWSNGPNSIGGLAPSNSITANQSNGIEIYSNDQLIQRNRIGVPPAGGPASGFQASDYGNGPYGILVRTAGNSIGGIIPIPPSGSIGVPNIIGHATNTSILLDDADSGVFDTSDNVIDFNYIGTDPEGMDFGNDNATGVVILSGHGNIVQNAIIQNHSVGVTLSSSTTMQDTVNSLKGNEITDHSFAGVQFFAAGQLGGTDASEANIIGNNLRGVHVPDTVDACCVRILGNYIGTDVDGNDLGNQVGIFVTGDNIVDIGWSDTGNVIGHNVEGITLGQNVSDTWIVGNHIGLHPTAGPVGNQTGIKYYVSTISGANATKVGYGASETIDPDNWDPGNGPGNIIAHSAIAGVDLSGGDANTINNAIRGNRFISNNGNAIDLGMDELDANFGDATGPNTQINFPAFDADLTNYDESTETIEFSYIVWMDTSNTNYPLIVDFYLTNDNSNEGHTYLGTDSYETGDAMSWKSGTLTPPDGVQVWNYLTATVTDQDGNTSQFTLEPVLMHEFTDGIFHDRFEQ